MQPEPFVHIPPSTPLQLALGLANGIHLPATFCSAHSVSNVTHETSLFVNQKSAQRFVAPRQTANLAGEGGGRPTGLFVSPTNWTDTSGGSSLLTASMHSDTANAIVMHATMMRRFSNIVC